LCEQLDYNLVFRWFVGLSIDEPIWDHSSFTKNRDLLGPRRLEIAGGRYTKGKADKQQKC
jgi:transposase